MEIDIKKIHDGKTFIIYIIEIKIFYSLYVYSMQDLNTVFQKTAPSLV